MKHVFGKKFILSSAGIILIFAAIVLVNVIAQNIYMRADLTEDNLYTLSQGTKNMLHDLPEHVTLKFFYSSSLENIPPHIETYAQRVQDLLDEYRTYGGDDLTIEEFNPTPDSDAQEWAQKYGIQGSPLNPMDPDTMLYFGIVAESLDNTAALPFLEPQREPYLEYDLSRMIYDITHPEKKTVGIISSLPVTGSWPMPRNYPQQPEEQKDPWVFVQELKKTFAVQNIPTNAPTIPGNIDLLLIIHPKDLAEQTLFAIDQFILNGGHTITFVDPFCNVDINNTMGFPMPGSSSLNSLFSAYGFTIPEDEVVADMDFATDVRVTPTRAERSPIWISGGTDLCNQDAIACAGLNTILFPVTGYVTTNENADNLEIVPYFTSSPNVMTLSSYAAQQGAQQLRSSFTPLNHSLTLAAHIRGAFSTAFPNGPPDSVTQTNTFKTKATKPVSLIVAADVDMLANEFNFQEVNFFGMKGYQPFNNNIDFVLNALDQLSGDDNLISLRSRATFRRPFTVVEELERDAQKKWLDHEKELSAKLQTVQQRIQQLEAQKDESQRLIINEQQQKEIEKFRQEQFDIARKLKDVRKKLRSEIDALGMKLAFYNIALVPIIIALFGIILALIKNYRSNAS